ncbi:uncharacterized protein B0J16DRAFT_388769 [Fusarium flagelliforme]|uniref:uncharacterized protein n=1 Tax=Fusarium flagelliforme TaxID=2675880 RepID=UPI001E8E4FD8|nr:uncharacterized protein B0J16DRAFT_388769 [Fusarium flagelliforme]KAH7174939.1 hypothetical protein B0J16DRAFT_388769 [Fusarium flagelliforme]
MAYYSVVKQCLTSLRSGANVLDDLKEQIGKDRKTDELFAQRLFYYETPDLPNSRLKRTAMSPPPTMGELTQWRMDWYTYQASRMKSRQKIIAWSDQLDGLIDGVRKHVGRMSTRNVPSRDESRVKAIIRRRSCIPLSLIPTAPSLSSRSATHQHRLLQIQEYDVDLMVVLAVSRMEDPIEGEEKWPPWWKRSPELCWWITQDVVEWLAQIPEEIKPEIAELGIEISEEEDNVIRILAEDAATHILIDSGDRLDRFRGPRF